MTLIQLAKLILNLPEDKQNIPATYAGKEITKLEIENYHHPHLPPTAKLH